MNKAVQGLQASVGNRTNTHTQPCPTRGTGMLTHRCMNRESCCIATAVYLLKFYFMCNNLSELIISYAILIICMVGTVKTTQ